MIEEGVLEDGRLGPRVDAVYGLHITSPSPVGRICCSDGPVMANSDRFGLSLCTIGSCFQ
jgi:metal-dependent amidase/aminoacylase/carboxypeptidase family protein